MCARSVRISELINHKPSAGAKELMRELIARRSSGWHFKWAIFTARFVPKICVS